MSKDCLLAGLLACWLAGLLACWLAGLLACWLAGLLACWLAGLLACWLAGLLACWLAGLLACLLPSLLASFLACLLVFDYSTSHSLACFRLFYVTSHNHVRHTQEFLTYIDNVSGDKANSYYVRINLGIF